MERDSIESITTVTSTSSSSPCLEGQIVDVEPKFPTPTYRRMRLIKSNEYSELRVRKFRSIESQQVGEVKQWPEVYDFLEIVDGWAKISPSEYRRVNRNYPSFNPETEGWCRVHSPVTEELLLENAP